MEVRFKQSATNYAVTINYVVDWFLTSDPNTVAHSESHGKPFWAVISPPNSNPIQLAKGDLGKPASASGGEYKIRIRAVNQVGSSGAAESAAFVIGPPGGVTDIEVLNPNT
jgi:hypothetical protein